MPTLTEAPQPAQSRRIIPSPEQSAPPKNMPPQETLDKWQRFVDTKTEFKLKDKEAAKVIGGEGAMKCNYVCDHLFPNHDVPNNTVEYMFNVAMLVKMPEALKNAPLPTFFFPVKDFFELFVPA